MSDYDRKPKGDPAILATVNSLKPDDYVLLSWDHNYITKNGSSYPDRPIVKLEKISATEAQKILNTSVPEE